MLSTITIRQEVAVQYAPLANAGVALRLDGRVELDRTLLHPQELLDGDADCSVRRERERRACAALAVRGWSVAVPGCSHWVCRRARCQRQSRAGSRRRRSCVPAGSYP